MVPRKVFKIGRSLVMTLPADLCDIFRIESGSIVRVGEMPGYGILVLRDDFQGKVPLPEARVKSMKDFIDQMVADFRRRVKQIGFSTTFNLYERMFSAARKEGIIRIKVPPAARKHAQELSKTNAAKILLDLLEEIEKFHRETLQGMGYVYDPKRAERIRAVIKNRESQLKELRI